MEDAMKRLALVLALLPLMTAPAYAEGARTETKLEVQAYYSLPNHEALGTRGFAAIDYDVLRGTADQRPLGSSWGGAGAKAILSRKLILPALVGAGALTKDNNLGLELSGEISPISLNANFEASLTPIAFLTFAAGAGGGSGWDIGFVGMGKNVGGDVVADNLGGLVWRAWARGAFQFDLAAALPGEWNHVVVLASPKVEYQAYTWASADEAWIWEADQAMNFNGWKLEGSYFLGYQMPIFLGMAGILFEPEAWLGSLRDKSTMASKGWGSDFAYAACSLVLNFRINDGSSIAVLPQFKNGIKWSDDTTRRKDFETRSYEGRYWYFYRVAFDYTLKL
jgi:hypothetical protein